MRQVLPIVALFLPACAAAAPPEGVVRSEQASFTVETVASGLERPWSLAFLPEGGFLVTERPGQLRRVGASGEVGPPIAGLPDNVAAQGQGGLLSVVLDPAFADNRLIYLSYAGAGDGGRNTEVARARLAEDGSRLEDLSVIFRALPKVGGGNHYGSRLAFDPDGRLFITLGDRFAYMDEAQNPGNHLGTVVRIEPDGAVPADNPQIEGGAEGVFSYGHRNVQGLARHPTSGVMWAHEHGPRGGDEVNVLRPGANYGWPAITYGIDYSGAIISYRTAAEGMEQPVTYWDPSIAPSGMAFYDGTAFPDWQGDLFVGALAGQHLRRLELDDEAVVAEEQLLGDMGARVRDVASGPDGALYLLTDSSDGLLLRLTPAE